MMMANAQHEPSKQQQEQQSLNGYRLGSLKSTEFDPVRQAEDERSFSAHLVEAI